MNSFVENCVRWWLMRGLAIVCLLLFILVLLGCSSAPVRIVERPIPPSLESRPVPSWGGVTYADLVEYALRLQEQAQACEVDKQAARAALGE